MIVSQIDILSTSRPSFKQTLASSELKRGLRRLGLGLVLESTGNTNLRFVLESAKGDSETYTIRAHQNDGVMTVTIDAASDQALLYGVFDFLERQGAYFGVDGDLYPLDAPNSLVLPEGDRVWHGEPRFATRGLQPWPDFLNCLTTFNREDFRAYLEAMLRMRFNTLGIHVYGQSNYWVEPWLSFEFGGVGHAAFADTTASDRWGYLPQRTSRFGMSAAQYFDSEVFGSDATRRARDPWEAAEMSQALWREAFSYADQLGIKMGIGFEPYQLPQEIVKACPPEVRREISFTFQGNSDAEVTHNYSRVDPASRTAQYILETRLAQLLEAYPSVAYVQLWEDELTNWQSQRKDTETPVELFRQAHDFLRRHAPDKRLVIAGWGGVARNFARFHRELPEDIIFAALSDMVGMDPIHEVFGTLDDRERWPIPWIEDDPSMWFPQLHVNRFERDLQLAEEYGCQGFIGVHWRHRIIDPVAGYQARCSWDTDWTPDAHYRAYARTQATGTRADAFADWLLDADTNRRLLATWTGNIREDGHHEPQAFSGDYSEVFLQGPADLNISDDFITQQTHALDALDALLDQVDSDLERERLGYWIGQSQFLDPYARAWQLGRQITQLVRDQHPNDNPTEAERIIAEQAVPLWVELLGHVREAALAFQHTVATRNDLGMLASIHNKFVRIATFRLRMSLLEFVDTLPADAEKAYTDALAPDSALEGKVIVPTRPTRLSSGESMTIQALAPGVREPVSVTFCWRPTGMANWNRLAMTHTGRRTYELVWGKVADDAIEYVVEAEFAGNPAPHVVFAPVEGVYLLTS